MPLPSRTQLVLLEIAVGAALIAVAFDGIWLPLGVSAALVSIVLALVTVHGRPLHTVIRSWIGMRLRRTGRPAKGSSRPRHAYRVVTVPSAGRGAAVGAIQGETTWSVPLALPLNQIFNQDPALDLSALATLLRIEDVPMSAVSVVSSMSPARAQRHLVLTLDTAHAASVIADRGGPAAIQQILRRCVLRAEEVLHAQGVEVMRLPESNVAVAEAASVGQVAAGLDASLALTGESAAEVRMPDRISRAFVITGADATERLDELARTVSAPVVATAVVIQPDAARRFPMVMSLLRISGSPEVVQAASARLRTDAANLGVGVSLGSGEQLRLLQATTLLGIDMGSAA